MIVQCEWGNDTPMQNVTAEFEAWLCCEHHGIGANGPILYFTILQIIYNNPKVKKTNNVTTFNLAIHMNRASVGVCLGPPNLLNPEKL